MYCIFIGTKKKKVSTLFANIPTINNQKIINVTRGTVLMNLNIFQIAKLGYKRSVINFYQPQNHLHPLVFELLIAPPPVDAAFAGVILQNH